MPLRCLKVLADGWGFDVARADYAPLGAGSYHWVVRDRAGSRGFVTVDDLDHKAWLGDEREVVFDGLRLAFGTALALGDGGLDFVVAPIAARDGETVRRVAPRYAMALFPFVDGVERMGPPRAARGARHPRRLLARLHARRLPLRPPPRTVGLDACRDGTISKQACEN